MMASSINLGRKSISKRRSLLTVQQENNSSILEDVISQDANDEEERLARRAKAQLQKNILNASVNTSESFSLKNINEQFVLYKHLFMENKITTKNAWNITIIDMLKHLCTNKNDLQVASISIDIGAKVYGLRVDGLYDEVSKMAKNMARAAQEETVSADEEVGNDSTQVEHSNKKSKRKRKKNVIAVDKNLTSRNIPKLESTDFTSRMNMDTGAIEHFFSNTLEDNGSSFVVLDKYKTFMDTIWEDHLHKNKKVIKNIYLPEPNLKINSKLENFSIDHDDVNETTNQVHETQLGMDVVHDENGIPIHELDHSLPETYTTDENNEDYNDYLDNEHVDEKENVDFNNFDSPNALPSHIDLTLVPNFAAQRKKYIDNLWAGPQHWKLKLVQGRKTNCLTQNQIKTENTEDTMNKTRGRKRMPIQELDFSEDVEINLADKIIKQKKRPTCNRKKITLPRQEVVHHQVSIMLKEFILKPGVFPVEKTSEIDCDLKPYNYSNLNDSAYCPQMDVSCSGEGSDGNDDNESTDHQACQQQNYLDDNLVSAPQMVSKLNLPFSVKSKHVDMKKLKCNLKGIINNSEEQQIKFSELYASLKKTMVNEKRESSCFTAFAALLHVCNENNYHLSSITRDNFDLVKS